jgi:DNA polymerase III delta prime subunit
MAEATTASKATVSKVPWVEKYKPTDFDDVILSDINKRIFSNILATREFPNVLFYGPPGTGKTTTIINLVKKYHEQLKQKHRALTIHLNASDDRGVEIVRTQIHQFVHMKQLFFPGIKFVILDEVDYMTDSAQQSLHHLIQTTTHLNVRFCLICNYVGKINDNLQNAFIKIRFNQLPVPNILAFLENISAREELNMSDAVLENIQTQFKSDVRSMINMMQTCKKYSSKQHHATNTKILNASVYEMIYRQIVSKIGAEESPELTRKTLSHLSQHIKEYSLTYNIGEIALMKEVVKYVIWNERRHANCAAFMDFAETVFHHKDRKNTVNKILLEIHAHFVFA